VQRMGTIIHGMENGRCGMHILSTVVMSIPAEGPICIVEEDKSKKKNTDRMMMRLMIVCGCPIVFIEHLHIDNIMKPLIQSIYVCVCVTDRRPLDAETERYAVPAEVIDRYLSPSQRDRVHGTHQGRNRFMKGGMDYEKSWERRDEMDQVDQVDDEEEEEEEEEEYIMSSVPARILVPPHAPCLEGYTAFPDAMLPTEVQPLMKRRQDGDKDATQEKMYGREQKRLPRRPIHISVDDPLHLGGYTEKTKELLERAYRMQYHSRRMREEKQREREREKRTSQPERNLRVRRRDQLGFIRRPTQ
jgi:hypothetical protein